MRHSLLVSVVTVLRIFYCVTELETNCKTRQQQPTIYTKQALLTQDYSRLFMHCSTSKMLLASAVAPNAGLSQSVYGKLEPRASF